ncbi:MAG: hypothetical protein KFF73_05790 [Cyclobacteriaceae bacterium]|nr:hypothetical protein [Cyclobacteriaceae bacterium]
MNVLMLSCKKATELIEKRSVVGLSIRERIQLKMHTSMCSACKAYEGQSQTIDLALDEFTKVKEQNHITLSAEARSRILKNLEKK